MSLGSGKIAKCTIGGIDCTSVITELDLFESIYTHAASCRIVINDASNVYQKANLQKGEVDIELSVGGDTGTIDCKFKSAEVKTGARKKDNFDVYTIMGVPSEFLKKFSEKKEVTKSYVDKPHSDTVKEIFQKYTEGSTTVKKDLNIEDTEGISAYYPKYDSPLVAISQINKSVKNSKKPGAPLLWQCLKTGYHCKSIESLKDEGSASTELKYAAANIPNADPKNQIIAYTNTSDDDSYLRNKLGTEKTAVEKVDASTGKLNKKDRDDNNKNAEPGKARYVKVSLTQGSGQSQWRKRDNQTDQYGKTKNKDQEALATYPKAHNIENRVLTTQVYGDINYKVGDKIKLGFAAASEDNVKDDKSGEYLITSVRSRWHKDDKDMRFYCILECRSATQEPQGGVQDG